MTPGFDFRLDAVMMRTATALEIELKRWLRNRGVRNAWSTARAMQEAWRSQSGADELLQKREELNIAALVSPIFVRFNRCGTPIEPLARAFERCVRKLPFDLCLLGVTRDGAARGQDLLVMAIVSQAFHAYFQLCRSRYGFRKFLDQLFSVLTIQASSSYHARLSAERGRNARNRIRSISGR